MMKPLLLTAAVVACSSSPAPRPVPAPAPATPAAAEPGEIPPVPTLRLPRNFVPTGYAARLAIDPAATGFEGAISITGEVATRSSVIWLHGRQLAIRGATAKRDSRAVPITVTPHSEDLLELRMATPLDPGPWTLALDYTGSYDVTTTNGAFKQTVGGDDYVFTQFESVHARRAFPCVDEPDSKVPWQLTLDVPEKLVAVANNRAVREQPLGNGKRRVEFATTRPLPTYLVAFGVGPFDIVDAGKSRGGTPIRAIVMRGRGAEAAYAVSSTPRILDLLEEFFASHYPYDKLDLLAIPVTVGFGAMENAGLITFAETIMLLDPKAASKGAQYSWVQTAAHEVAHQWFGDLVTTAWWDDIWLNEGFATWAEHKITAAFEPAWQQELAAVGAKEGAMNEDELVSARQIRQPITSVDDIQTAFDGITYEKGAAVLDMFEAYVGRETFLRGVREYLAHHAWGNATSRDFVAAIVAAAGKDLTPAFSTFLDRPGVPELTATAVCDAGQPPRIALAQHRYVPPGAPTPPAAGPWQIPVCAAYDKNGARAEACTLLDAATGWLALETETCPRWVMANVGGRGYYRVASTTAQVEALRDRAWPLLAPAERSAVVNDVIAGATTGKLPVVLALSFVPGQLAAGDRFSVRSATAIPFLIDDVIDAKQRPRFEAWMRRTFGPAARRAGLAPSDRDSLDTETARVSLLTGAATLGRDPALTAEAVKLTRAWRELPQATRRKVIQIAAHSSGAVFDQLLAAAPGEPDRARRRTLFSVLGQTPDVARQRAALELVLDARVDFRDAQQILFTGRYEPNKVAAQEFVKAHLDELVKRMPEVATGAGASVFAYVFTASCVAARRDEIADYVTRTFTALSGGPRLVKQAIEGMDQCIARRALVEPAIRSWLDKLR